MSTHEKKGNVSRDVLRGTFAAIGYNEDMLDATKHLVEELGADIDEVLGMLIFYSEHKPAVQYLIEAKADPNIAIKAVTRSENKPMIKYLLDSKANTGLALQHFIRCENIDMINHLVGLKADVNCEYKWPNGEIHTPLTEAAWMNKPKSVVHLLELKADINLRDPLSVAILGKSNESAKLLTAAGAKV